MQPHSSVGVRCGTIGIYQVSLEPSDKAVMARHCRILVHEILHAIVDMAGWNLVWAILYPDSLGVVFAEILRFEKFHIWIIRDYEVNNQYMARVIEDCYKPYLEVSTDVFGAKS